MATSYKTPGIYFNEIDKSEVVASAGNSLGGTVIVSKKGPINRKITISNDRDYIATFGAPVATTTNGSKVLDWGYNGYAARAHLQGGGGVEVIRASSSADKFGGVGLNASVTTSADAFKTFTSGIPCAGTYLDEDKYNYIYDIEACAATSGVYGTSATSAAALAVFTLNGPGANTEGYSVGIEGIGTLSDWLYSYDDYVAVAAASAAPSGTSLIAARIVKVHIFSTIGGTVPVETFYGSFDPDLIVNGNSVYLPDVINGNSAAGVYLKVFNATALNTSAMMNKWKPRTTSAWAGPVSASLTGGVSTAAALNNIAAPYAYFKTSNLAYVIDANPGEASAGIIDPLLSKRQNALGILQAKGTAIDAQIKSSYISSLTDGTSSYNTSYGTSYVGFKQVKDAENGKFVWLPNAVSACYTNALTDTVANVWDAPSGEGRGNIACIDQLPLFDDDDIGQLYDINYNCIKKFPGEGFVIFGQKTRQRKKSALDRITTRKTLNTIKKSLASSLKSLVLTTNNTPGVRLRTANNINDYLKSIIAAGGLTAGTAICDDTNNTPQVIDNHILAIDIVVQPVQTIEFIQINIVITRTGVSVSEALVA